MPDKIYQSFHDCPYEVYHSLGKKINYSFEYPKCFRYAPPENNLNLTFIYRLDNQPDGYDYISRFTVNADIYNSSENQTSTLDELINRDKENLPNYRILSKNSLTLPDITVEYVEFSFHEDFKYLKEFDVFGQTACFKINEYIWQVDFLLNLDLLNDTDQAKLYFLHILETFQIID